MSTIAGASGRNGWKAYASDATMQRMASAPLWASETLLRWWDADATGIRTRHVSAVEIAQLERRYAIELPAPFLGYLTHACPTGEQSLDNELTDWWGFERICSVADGYEHELGASIAQYRDKLVLFADYSLWCWAWAINCEPGKDHGKVAVIAGRDHDRFVADSFDSFVAKYIEDDGSVFP